MTRLGPVERRLVERARLNEGLTYVNPGREWRAYRRLNARGIASAYLNPGGILVMIVWDALVTVDMDLPNVRGYLR